MLFVRLQVLENDRAYLNYANEFIMMIHNPGVLEKLRKSEKRILNTVLNYTMKGVKLV